MEPPNVSILGEKGSSFSEVSQPCTSSQPRAVMQLTILGKSPNPVVNHRFRPFNGHFIGSQWPMVATTFRESWRADISTQQNQRGQVS